MFFFVSCHCANFCPFFFKVTCISLVLMMIKTTLQKIIVMQDKQKKIQHGPYLLHYVSLSLHVGVIMEHVRNLILPHVVVIMGRVLFLEVKTEQFTLHAHNECSTLKSMFLFRNYHSLLYNSCS